MEKPECPICNTDPPCAHLQVRTEPVIHYKIPQDAFSTDLQLVGYLQNVMHYAKTSGLPLGSRLHQTLQKFMVDNDMPFDVEVSKPPESP